MIDIDHLEKFIDENPLHHSPEEHLEMTIEMYPELAYEATLILVRWEQENPGPELRRFEAEAFFQQARFCRRAGRESSAR